MIFYRRFRLLLLTVSPWVVGVSAVGFLPLGLPSTGPSTLSLLLEISSGFPTKHIFGENILFLNHFIFFHGNMFYFGKISKHSVLGSLSFLCQAGGTLLECVFLFEINFKEKSCCISVPALL